MPDRQNAVALALGGLAIAIASTGTAVAVTITTVQIADPTTPSHVAHVTSAGRLTVDASISNTPAVKVAAPGQPLSVGTFVEDGQVTALMGPTTATIAINRIALEDSGQNAGNPYASIDYGLVKITVGSHGTCSDADDSVSSYLELDRVDPGQDFVSTYPSALVFKPTGTTPYCIGFRAFSEGTTFQPYYIPFVELTGFLVAGSYSTPFASTAARSATGAAPRKLSP